jgi:dienelactone hydrolase
MGAALAMPRASGKRLAAIAELASHGYVVVGLNHTYETAVTVFADGRIIPMNPDAVADVLGPQTGPHEERFRQRAAVCDYKAADLASVADRLAKRAVDAVGPLGGRVDLDRLGAFGHSFGGNAALEWCRNDQRCLAAANLDGALWTEVGRVGLNRPVLQVLAEHPEFARSGSEAVAAGVATDAAAFDAEKAMAFDGWRASRRCWRDARPTTQSCRSGRSSRRPRLRDGVISRRSQPRGVRRHGMAGRGGTSTRGPGPPARSERRRP